MCAGGAGLGSLGSRSAIRAPSGCAVSQLATFRSTAMCNPMPKRPWMPPPTRGCRPTFRRRLHPATYLLVGPTRTDMKLVRSFVGPTSSTAARGVPALRKVRKSGLPDPKWQVARVKISLPRCRLRTTQLVWCEHRPILNMYFWSVNETCVYTSQPSSTPHPRAPCDISPGFLDETPGERTRTVQLFTC